jgi:3-hydroxyisobutyrate dehydrogenase-like beta-hydroxyacid dehydrogenase
MTTVAFLGLGRMGVPMAVHVARAGHALTVWNRTPGRAAPLTELGAREARTPAEAVAGAEVVVLMLFGPDAVREVLPAVVRGAPAGALVVDASTIGPAAAHEFARTCADGGLRYVDAPVAGSVKPATDGTLGVFLGGTADDVAQARPLVELWADPARVVHVGGVGSASALKLCVNQGLGVMAAGLGESLRLGRDLGLDRDLLLLVLSQTAYGWYLGQKLAMVQSGDYSGTTFSIDLMEKDLALAVAASDSDLELTRAALDQARRALAAGHGGEDYAAITGHVADEGSAGSF